jgi:hypothetical protein
LPGKLPDEFPVRGPPVPPTPSPTPNAGISNLSDSRLWSLAPPLIPAGNHVNPPFEMRG